MSESTIFNFSDPVGVQEDANRNVLIVGLDVDSSINGDGRSLTSVFAVKREICQSHLLHARIREGGTNAIDGPLYGESGVGKTDHESELWMQ
jgi:hypothetical protein